jgi:hypothetical protein
VAGGEVNVDPGATAEPLAELGAAAARPAIDVEVDLEILGDRAVDPIEEVQEAPGLGTHRLPVGRRRVDVPVTGGVDDEIDRLQEELQSTLAEASLAGHRRRRGALGGPPTAPDRRRIDADREDGLMGSDVEAGDVAKGEAAVGAEDRPRGGGSLGGEADGAPESARVAAAALDQRGAGRRAVLGAA